MIDQLRTDGRLAVRSLVRTPLPVVAAILTLAVAAGVNMAMFGLIDRALLSPPPGLRQPEQLFTLGFQPPGARAGAGAMTTTSYVTYADIRDGVAALAGAAAFQRAAATVLLDADQRRVNGVRVSGEYFGVLGARAMLGRTIEVADNVSGATPVAVVSHAFWRSALQRDPKVVGRRLSIRDVDYEIVGVMPAGVTGHSAAAADVWLPFAAAMQDSPGWDRDRFRNLVSIVVRVGEGQPLSAVETQAAAVVGRGVTTRGLAGAAVTDSDRRVAWWLAGVSVLVLAIGLANAAILLLVRAVRTRHDLAVRAALGASRRRLLTQGALESLAIAGGVTLLSWVLSSWMDDAVRRVLFPDLQPRAGATTIGVLAAAVAGSLAFLVSSLVAARTWPPAEHAAALSGRSPGATRRSRTMTGLLLIQSTVCVILLAGAGLFGASLYRLWAQDFGMRMDEVLIVDFELGPERIDGQDEILQRALLTVRPLPGVEMATTIDAIPFSGFNVPPIAVPGRAEPPAVGQQLPYLTAATPEFLSILGIQLVEGRMLSDDDDRGTPVVMVNQSMARGVWPGESAVGKCIRIGFDPDFDPSASFGPPIPSDRVPCREVVGVVRDVRQRSVLPFDNEDRLMQYFVPPSQAPFPPFAGNPPRTRGLILRVAGDARAMTPAVRRAVVGERRDLPFVRVRPYAELLDRQVRPWSMGTTLLALFSTLALLVASMGLYAAFAHAVTERRREMAIRMAIGAAPSTLIAMVLGEAVRVSASGAMAGCLVALAAGRWLQSLLFGTEASDPLVLVSAAVLMVVVAVLATVRPARVAAQSDPAALLKVD